MTRGNQRDNDRAKALKKAGNTVRLFLENGWPATDPFTEEQEHPDRFTVPEDQGGRRSHHAREAEEGYV